MALPVPALGAEVLRHDAEFRALDATFGELRDVVNRGVDALCAVGIDLPRLPEGSLEELLVLPLTGDHRRIRQNAEAVGHVADALTAYARSTAGLALAVDLRWSGAAAASCLVRVGRHAALARGCAELVRAAAPAFEEVAEASERIAIEVEELVVELVEKGRRLATRLLARVSGPLGWGVFATEVALHGFDAVTDLVDDVRRLIAIVERLTTLQDEVAAWVEEQRGRLDALREVADAARGLAA